MITNRVTGVEENRRRLFLNNVYFFSRILLVTL
jgi:hypothetical protein